MSGQERKADVTEAPKVQDDANKGSQAELLRESSPGTKDAAGAVKEMDKSRELDASAPKPELTGSYLTRLVKGVKDLVGLGDAGKEAPKDGSKDGDPRKDKPNPAVEALNPREKQSFDAFKGKFDEITKGASPEDKKLAETAVAEAAKGFGNYANEILAKRAGSGDAANDPVARSVTEYYKSIGMSAKVEYGKTAQGAPESTLTVGKGNEKVEIKGTVQDGTVNQTVTGTDGTGKSFNGVDARSEQGIGVLAKADVMTHKAIASGQGPEAARTTEQFVKSGKLAEAMGVTATDPSARKAAEAAIDAASAGKPERVLEIVQERAKQLKAASPELTDTDVAAKMREDGVTKAVGAYYKSIGIEAKVDFITGRAPNLLEGGNGSFLDSRLELKTGDTKLALIAKGNGGEVSARVNDSGQWLKTTDANAQEALGKVVDATKQGVKYVSDGMIDATLKGVDGNPKQVTFEGAPVSRLNARGQDQFPGVPADAKIIKLPQPGYNQFIASVERPDGNALYRLDQAGRPTEITHTDQAGKVTNIEHFGGAPIGGSERTYWNEKPGEKMPVQADGRQGYPPISEAVLNGAMPKETIAGLKATSSPEMLQRIELAEKGQKAFQEATQGVGPEAKAAVAKLAVGDLSGASEAIQASIAKSLRETTGGNARDFAATTQLLENDPAVQAIKKFGEATGLKVESTARTIGMNGKNSFGVDLTIGGAALSPRVREDLTTGRLDKGSASQSAESVARFRSTLSNAYDATGGVKVYSAEEKSKIEADLANGRKPLDGQVAPEVAVPRQSLAQKVDGVVRGEAAASVGEAAVPRQSLAQRADGVVRGETAQLASGQAGEAALPRQSVMQKVENGVRESAQLAGQAVESPPAKSGQQETVNGVVIDIQGSRASFEASGVSVVGTLARDADNPKAVAVYITEGPDKGKFAQPGKEAGTVDYLVNDKGNNKLVATDHIVNGVAIRSDESGDPNKTRPAQFTVNGTKFEGVLAKDPKDPSFGAAVMITEGERKGLFAQPGKEPGTVNYYKSEGAAGENKLVATEKIDAPRPEAASDDAKPKFDQKALEAIDAIKKQGANLDDAGKEKLKELVRTTSDIKGLQDKLNEGTKDNPFKLVETTKPSNRLNRASEVDVQVNGQTVAKLDVLQKYTSGERSVFLQDKAAQASEARPDDAKPKFDEKALEAINAIKKQGANLDDAGKEKLKELVRTTSDIKGLQDKLNEGTKDNPFKLVETTKPSNRLNRASEVDVQVNGQTVAKLDVLQKYTTGERVVSLQDKAAGERAAVQLKDLVGKAQDAEVLQKVQSAVESIGKGELSQLTPELVKEIPSGFKKEVGGVLVEKTYEGALRIGNAKGFLKITERTISAIEDGQSIPASQIRNFASGLLQRIRN